MNITQKGQVTIPQAIREQFGLLPHTEIEFVIEAQQVILRSKKVQTIAESIKSLRGIHKGRFTADELLAQTRDSV